MEYFVLHSQCIFLLTMCCGSVRHVIRAFTLNQQLPFYMLILFNVEMVGYIGWTFHSAVPIWFGVNSSANYWYCLLWKKYANLLLALFGAIANILITLAPLKLKHRRKFRSQSKRPAKIKIESKTQSTSCQSDEYSHDSTYLASIPVGYHLSNWTNTHSNYI